MNKTATSADSVKGLGYIQGGFLNPYINIIDNASKEVKKLGYKKIGLLGSTYIMNGNFFKKPFLDKGIDIVTPKNDQKDYINKKIAQELERGVVEEETFHGFVSIIQEMMDEEDIEAVLLGCTELEVLFENRKVPVPCINIMKDETL